MTPVLLDVVFVSVAAAMAATTALFVRWAAEPRSGLRAAVVVFLLLMMTGMLGGALAYVLAPSARSAVEGLWIASAVMSAAVVLVFVAFLREASRWQETTQPPAVTSAGRPLVAGVILLVVANEFLMGWLLSCADGALARGLPAGLLALATWAGAVVVSPWFVFTMAAEMLITVVLLRRLLPRGAVALLLAQAGLMALSPPAFPSSASDLAALYGGSVAMIGLFVYLMELLYRQRSLAPAFARYLARLLPVYALMMAGLFLWVLYGSTLLFAAAVLLEMVVFFEAVLRPAPFSEPARFAWQESPAWTTGVLATVFVSELFMGGLLAFLLTPSAYLPGPRLPLAGPAGVAVGNALANGFFFVADTTASTWFLLMMGLEMGALVALRLPTLRLRETRARLALMLGSYAAFAVFYPSVYYARVAPHAPGAASSVTVPVLGWSMGLGSAPVAPALFGVIAATYVAFALVTVLFGRRAICSVFCTAATMFQGTTIDAMKSFNRSSPTARRYLGSRFSGAYRMTAVGVLVAFSASAVVSYLDAVGRWAVSVGGVDPTVFLFDLSFGVLWYALFVTVPYAGDYNCVTMGWCYTGLLAGLTSRVGFFRLKVRDRAVCRACTTFDCARSCPVGLTDMPAQFRTRGEFRSSKCCGVGNCAEACPYDNLYLADVRHSVLARLRRRALPSPRAMLPMVEPGPATPAPSPAASRLPP